MESSCAYFLAKHNFDFKKSFYNGINCQRLGELEDYQNLAQCSESEGIKDKVSYTNEALEDREYKKTA